MSAVYKIPYERSFASQPKAKCWHPTKNEKVVPRGVYKSTGKKYWFICDTCNHDFDARLDNITKGKWCPYCANKKLCNDEKCEKCFNHSFASQPKAPFWHPTKNEKVVPRGVSKSTHTKYWFICGDCNHPFDAGVNNISCSGNWCPYCAKHRGKLCDDEECQHCFNRSFASHPKAPFWHPTKNKKVVPRQVFKSSPNTKYWFICDTCNHDFDVSLGNITHQGNWCPHCVNKTETKMKEHLEREKENLYIESIKHQYKPNWTRVNGTSYKYDFYIKLTNGVKLIIEVDGRQHYEQVSNWGTPLHNQIRDCIKERLAGQQEINLIRLNQEHIWEDKENWQQKLHEFIQRKYVNNREIEIYDACCW